MIKNSENGTDVNSSMLEKKEWVEPQMTQLDVKETKGGKFAFAFDNGHFFEKKTS